MPLFKWIKQYENDNVHALCCKTLNIFTINDFKTKSCCHFVERGLEIYPDDSRAPYVTIVETSIVSRASFACHGPGVMAESTSYRYKTIINLTPAQTRSATANTPTLHHCSRDKYGYDYHSCRIKTREKLVILMTICHKPHFDTIMTCPTHSSRNEQWFEILQASNHHYVQNYVHT